MCNTLKDTIERLEYSQKSVALATGISEARLSNLCNMTQSKLDSTIKLKEYKSIEQFLEGLYLCVECESIFTQDEVDTIEEFDMGHVFNREDRCAKCGSPEFYEIDFMGEDFYAP